MVLSSLSLTTWKAANGWCGMHATAPIACGRLLQPPYLHFASALAALALVAVAAFPPKFLPTSNVQVQDLLVPAVVAVALLGGTAPYPAAFAVVAAGPLLQHCNASCYYCGIVGSQWNSVCCCEESSAQTRRQLPQLWYSLWMLAHLAVAVAAAQAVAVCAHDAAVCVAPLSAAAEGLESALAATSGAAAVFLSSLSLRTRMQFAPRKTHTCCC